MIAHIDRPIAKRCWNPYDSYGEMCVHCGCCSPDKAVRYPARIELLERQIADFENFDRWMDDPEWRAVQEKNIKENLRYFKRQLRYYRKKVAES